jgi:predicted metal-dependent phosphoesterase TrpH
VPLKIDLHVHTRYSYDAYITPDELVRFARRRALDGVAITDHSTVAGLPEFGRIRDLLVIPGVEVATAQGHVLALNVDTVMPEGLGFAETVEAIHDAAGVAVLAHPTAFFKGVADTDGCDVFDGIEVINASAIPFFYSVRKNRELAARLDLPQTGGSDAHCAPELGTAYSLIDAARDVDAVVQAIVRGAVEPYGRAIPWRLRLTREYLSLRKRWGGRG